MREVFTAKSFMVQKEGNYLFTFFCELCDWSYTTGLINSNEIENANLIASKEARTHFNLCHLCHKWVCDRHYREDLLMCVSCFTKEKKRSK